MRLRLNLYIHLGRITGRSETSRRAQSDHEKISTTRVWSSAGPGRSTAHESLSRFEYPISPGPDPLACAVLQQPSCSPPVIVYRLNPASQGLLTSPSTSRCTSPAKDPEEVSHGGSLLLFPILVDPVPVYIELGLPEDDGAEEKADVDRGEEAELCPEGSEGR